MGSSHHRAALTGAIAKATARFQADLRRLARTVLRGELDSFAATPEPVPPRGTRHVAPVAGPHRSTAAAPSLPAAAARTPAAAVAATRPAATAPTKSAAAARTRKPAAPAPTKSAAAPTRSAAAPTKSAAPAPTKATVPAPTKAVAPALTKSAAPAPTKASPAPTKAAPAPTRAVAPAPTKSAAPAPTTSAARARTKAAPAPTTSAARARTKAAPAPTTSATGARTQAAPAPTKSAARARTQAAAAAPTRAAAAAPTESAAAGSYAELAAARGRPPIVEPAEAAVPRESGAAVAQLMPGLAAALSGAQVAPTTGGPPPESAPAPAATHDELPWGERARARREDSAQRRQQRQERARIRRAAAGMRGGPAAVTRPRTEPAAAVHVRPTTTAHDGPPGTDGTRAEARRVQRGTVKWFSEAKGYGFIQADDGTDAFVHYSSISSDGFRTLSEGQAVSYEEVAGPKGLLAVNVVPTAQATEALPRPSPPADPRRPPHTK